MRTDTGSFTETVNVLHLRLLDVAPDAGSARSNPAEAERHPSLALRAGRAVGRGHPAVAHLARHMAVVGGHAVLQRGEVLDVVEEVHALLVDTRSDGLGFLLLGPAPPPRILPRPLRGGRELVLREAGELVNELVLELLEVHLNAEMKLVLELVGAEGICFRVSPFM